MNLAQTKIYLEKIIALYKNMSADERNISPIERDLMLSYIRQLYETCLDTPSVSTPSTAAAPPKVAPPPPPTPKVETPHAVEQPKIAPPPRVPPSPVSEPVQYVVPPVVEQPRYTPPPPPPVVEQPRYAPPPPVPTPEPPRTRPMQSSSSGASAEVEALFEEQVGKEISDRLSNAPVADLTKAFGLNDRLLMQNDLFLGNKTAFDEALKDLNNASSFDTARAFLADLAARNNWNLNAERQKNAKAFIKLVRRRFK